MDLKDIGDLAKKVNTLEKNLARADYLLSEVMSILKLDPDCWAMRNYAKYLKEKGGD